MLPASLAPSGSHVGTGPNGQWRGERGLSLVRAGGGGLAAGAGILLFSGDPSLMDVQAACAS